jgi:dTDP-glucose pyrophosphorylase
LIAVRKVVILAAGRGTRMRRSDDDAALTTAQSRVAETGVKALLPVGRPFLDYVLSAIADAGYEHVCLVIGPEHRVVRDYYTVEAPPRRLTVSFAVQPEPHGTADALLAAEEFTSADQFVTMNSDNYYPASVLATLRTAGEPSAPLFERQTLVRESNIPVDRVRSYAVGLVGEDGYLQSLVEKPDQGTLDGFGRKALISMNCWRFSPMIFQACRSIAPSFRGELELTSAVNELIGAMGGRLRVIRCRAGVLDLSQRADIAAIAERLRSVEAIP